MQRPEIPASSSSTSASPLADVPPPPESWGPMRRVARRAVRPIESFLATEAAGGVVLLIATVVALVWASSPWAEHYRALWELPLGVQLGELRFERSMHFWVNEVLMTAFFFVVGLEIRREIARGELSDLRRASLPIAAALGGMIVPALAYVVLNAGRPTASGWGVPMATDIAFAVGVLALLGDRVPPALRILLLALAVIDDVGAIVVIGVFYAHGFDPTGIPIAFAGVVLVLVLQRMGIRRAWLYLPAGALVWEGIHVCGVHPTLAGVVLGLMTPATPWLGRAVLAKAAASVAEDVAAHPEDDPDLSALDLARREASAPVDLLQHALHPWVAFVIMPVFALANAGVSFDGLSLDAGAWPPALGIVVGLVIGKPLGILLGCFLAVRLGATTLPRGVTFRGVAVVGAVGGIGFTMSLFIAELAFAPADLPIAKLAILVGTALAAALGLGLGRLALGTKAAQDGARTESDAEASTDA